MKRRSFLKNTSIFTLPTVLGGLNLAAMPSSLMSAMVSDDNDKVLVLIDLNGGNDGLNTFIPLDAYDNLANARANVIIPQNKIIGMTNTIGLHPSMTGVKSLFDNGNLSLVQGVAYANQNRSHFRSADIWNTGVNAGEYKNTGWLGRYLDDQFPGYPDGYPNAECTDPFAITMGRSISGTCQGVNSNFSMAIIDPNNIGGLNTGIEAALPNDCYGRELGFLVETFKKTNAYADRVVEAAESGNSMMAYPDTDISNQLKTVAKLISGGLQTKVFVLRLGGFDTHAEQVENDTTKGWHANLLEQLSDAIYAFQEDLKMLGVNERVLGMTFSEFGRKIISNAGSGTDHGTAAPMMVFGSCVNAGVLGSNPEIGTNVGDEEGVAMQYDFKSVYGSILMDWFEVEEDKVKALLTDDFQYIPIISGCSAVATEELVVQWELKTFPNPFVDHFKVDLRLAKSMTLGIDLFDVMGKRVKTITRQQFDRGAHRVPIEASALAAGIYFVRVQVGSTVKTARMVKR